MDTLTTRESEILVLSWECFKTESSVNYSKLGELAGLKNSASAKAAYHGAKKKMLAKGSSKLSPREREMLALSWKCCNTPPQVDYAKLAEKAGSKNEGSTKTVFCAARKKMLADAESTTDGTNGAEGSATPAKKTRKTLPSARNKAAAVDEEGDSLGKPTSPEPAKKRRRENAVNEPRRKSSAILAAVADEGEEYAEVKEAPKKKKMTRGKGKKARSELRGNRGDDDAQVKGEPEQDGMVRAALFDSAQEFLKMESEED